MTANSMLDAAIAARLVAAALEVRSRAYCPYSGYQVGAALLTEEGAIFSGCNVENASYGLTICAERSALTAAVSAGARRFVAIAVVTADGGSPCGACRQALCEFGLDLIVIIANARGEIVSRAKLAELLPQAFTGKH